MTGILIVKPFAGVAGSDGGEVSIDNHDFTGPTEATFWVSSVGLIYGTQNNDNVTVAESWIEPQIGMSNFDVMVHQVSGNVLGTTSAAIDATMASLDTWLQLNSMRWWGYGSVSGARAGTFEVSIRRRSDNLVLDTATFTLYTPGDSGSGGDGGTPSGGAGTGTGSGGLLEKTYLALD